MDINFKKIVIQASELVKPQHITQVQSNIEAFVKSLNIFPFIRGDFVELNLLTGQDNIVHHGLDREVQGWTVVNQNANANVWQSSTVNKLKDKQIILNVSANVTVKIYFF